MQYGRRRTADRGGQGILTQNRVGLKEVGLAKRLEKSGFWVLVTAVFFYPIAAIGKVVTRNAERIRRSDGMLLVMNHVSHLDPAVG